MKAVSARKTVKQIGLRLPLDEADKLEELARRNLRSASAEARMAVRKHLKEAA